MFLLNEGIKRAAKMAVKYLNKRGTLITDISLV
jgi:hypothetical protein